jgi:transposase InsO family protein
MSTNQRELNRRLRILKHARESGNIAQTCRYFGIGRSTFYEWRARFDKGGLEGLEKKKPIGKRWPNQLSDETVEKILHLRKTYHLGPERIMWYLERYHGIKICCNSVYRTLVRNGVRRLPKYAGRRKVHTKRYAKQVPGHHIQFDVKFLSFQTNKGNKVKRYQYTAIDDATRVRALKIYEKHNQKSSIDFFDYVVEKFHFRIQQIRTDRGHEWQAKFHWHVEDTGIRHVYIKPRSPQLNGKVERSHRSDQEEFYQLLSYKGDVDLNKKLEVWEHFYNFNRPHGAHRGKTPYEALRIMIK